jgi:hypothetical protein
MKQLFSGLLLACLINTPIHAQYYYKDILSNKQVVADMAAYRESKLRTIRINSFESDGTPSEDFFCEKKLTKDYKKSSLYTRTGQSGSSLLESFFNDKGVLEKTFDSSAISIGTNSYFYDETGRINRIVSEVRSSDDDFLNELIEEHLYEYNENNLPVKMTRVKNKRDSTVFLFLFDEEGNVSIEKDTKTGAKYYYYYDARHRLTDVVHANEYRKNLVADYIFEYNDAGQVTQMTVTEEGGNNFYIWRYDYDNKLRTQERIFSRDRKLMGRIEYEYK